VTKWGLALLLAYVVLGLSPMESRRAVRYLVVLTVGVLALVGVKNGSL
jgi:hypothetical protein